MRVSFQSGARKSAAAIEKPEQRALIPDQGVPFWDAQ